MIGTLLDRLRFGMAIRRRRRSHGSCDGFTSAGRRRPCREARRAWDSVFAVVRRRLLDYAVCLQQDQRRNLEIKRPGGLQIDDEMKEFCAPYRDIAGIRAAKYRCNLFC